MEIMILMLLALGKASSITYSTMLLLHCRLTCHKDEVFYYYYMFVYLYYMLFVSLSRFAALRVAAGKRF